MRAYVKVQVSASSVPSVSSVLGICSHHEDTAFLEFATNCLLAIAPMTLELEPLHLSWAVFRFRPDSLAVTLTESLRKDRRRLTATARRNRDDRLRTHDKFNADPAFPRECQIW
jgi:hypothetical protein